MKDEDKINTWKGTIFNFRGDFVPVLLGNVGSRFLNMVSFIFLARWLGPGEFGNFSIVYSLMMLLGQLPSGLDLAFIRHYSRGDVSEKKIYKEAHVFLKLIFFTTLIIVAMPASSFLAGKFFNNPDLSFPINLSFWGAGFYILFMNLPSYFQARESFLKLASSLFLYNLFILCAIFSLHFIQESTGYLEYFLVVVAGTLFFTLMAIYFLLKPSLVKKSGGIKLLWERAKSIFHFGKWILVAGGMYVLFQRIDLLLLAHFTPPEVVGTYSVAVKGSAIFAIFMTSFATITFPRACKITSRENFVDYISRSTKLIVLLISLNLLMILFSRQLILIIFGATYLQSAQILRVLLLAAIPLLLTIPLSNLFYTANRPKLVAWLNAVELLAAVPLCYILIPKYSAMGAAVALLLTYSIGLLYAVVMFTLPFFRKDLPFKKEIKNIGN
jgi:O-antigen/teichoic acid export membrane protein